MVCLVILGVVMATSKLSSYLDAYGDWGAGALHVFQWSILPIEALNS